LLEAIESFKKSDPLDSIANLEKDLAKMNIHEMEISPAQKT
jgi:hypothetical protein